MTMAPGIVDREARVARHTGRRSTAATPGLAGGAAIGPRPSLPAGGFDFKAGRRQRFACLADSRCVRRSAKEVQTDGSVN